MKQRSVVLASFALLVAAACVAWWWCSGEMVPATESARAEERTDERVFVPVATASGANADGPADADRSEVGNEFDDKHVVRIPTRDLRIHVFDDLDRTPVEGVTFGLDKYEVAGLPPLGTAVSASDGMATFAIPTDRRLHLTVASKGFTLDRVLIPDEPIGTPEQPLAIALPRRASIHGRLFGPSGEPLSADGLSLHTETRRGGETRIGGRARSRPTERSRESTRVADPDANEFLFEGVPAETDVDLLATYGDHDERQESQSFCLEPGERREIEWRLGPRSRSSLAGRIVDETGEPLAGAFLGMSKFRRFFLESGDGVRMSDANGEFELGDLDAGRCVVEVTSPDPRHANGSFTCTLAPGESRRGVVIELARAAPLIVHARLADGSIPTSVNASAAAPTVPFTMRRPSAIGTDGTITIDAVPLGEVDVEVYARTGDSEASGHVRFRHDGEHECVVDCVALASLRGSVELASGKPVNSTVLVSLIRRGGALQDELFRNGTDTKSNEFEIKAARAGEFDVVALTQDGLVGVLPSLSLAAGEQREGVVVRMEPGATLRLMTPSLDDRATPSLRSFDLLDLRVLRDGACVARASVAPGRPCELTVPPGRLTVEIRSSGAVVASREVEAHAFEVARVRF